MLIDTPSKRRSKQEPMASKNKTTGSDDTQAKQVKPPAISSDALYRRAVELSRQVQQESLVDKEKVSRIKAAIENGTYKVNPVAIAEKLMEMEIKMTEKGKS